MGCAFAQGYFFSAPVEAEEALDQLRSDRGLRGTIPVAPVAANEPGLDATAIDYAATLVLPAEMIAEGNVEDDSAEVVREAQTRA